MKIKTVICLGMLWLAPVMVWSADRTIKIATDVPYEPMEYETPEGELTGFDIDLGNALCAEVGVTCEWVIQNWNGIIPGLLYKKYDAIMSNMTITDERSKQVLFTDPYIVLANSFYVPVDGDLEDINDDSLRGKKVGVQRGTIQDEYVSDAYKGTIEVKRYQSADDMIVDLSVGRLDAIFVSDNTGQAALLDQYPDEYRQIGPHFTEPAKYFGYGQGMAFRQDDTALVKQFNAAIKTLKNNGRYEDIYREYFHAAPPAE